ncbi:MAG TPA: CpaD family pilus assembly protein [Sphingomicrobium sp.]
MRSKFRFLLIASAALAGCSYTPHDLPDRGVEAVNVPVVSRADYVFDAAAPGGTLAPGEKARLDAWFRGLDLGYGDSIHVDAPAAQGARYDVAQVAANYGMTVQAGAPVTAGGVPAGMARVIVTRTRAQVPGCPNWSVPSQPNFNNRTMSNFGCGVNSNIAAMVANPEDLIHGRESTDLGSTVAGTKAVILYRTTPPSGSKGLQATSTKGGN